MNKYSLLNVISNETIMNDYIRYLNNSQLKTIKDILNYARTICDGLPSEEDIINTFKTNKNIKDKGLFGKIIEYGIFGQKPNSSSAPDLPTLGYDIKACAFKMLQNKGKNAKERQTLTNCGTTSNYESFKDIVDNERFEDCKYYKKSKNFILFVRNDDKKKLKTLDEMLNQSMLVIVYFNMDTISIEMKNTIMTDYASIRQCILEKRVSQKGQKYLHIHPHGMGHGSGNRALGFTSNFITLFVASKLAEIHKKNIEDILFTKGRSTSIKKEYI
jgi:hypothetical protein